MTDAMLAGIVYVALTAATAVSLWLFLGACRELRRFRRNGTAASARQRLPEILQLHAAGLDTTHIAKQLGLRPAEIQFLLEVARARTHRTTSFAAA